jgi:TDG/mug DNA glycosylase family protein
MPLNTIVPATLRDQIKPGVRVLFVGINPGTRSAAVGHHFAGYSNRFWKLLRDSRLVPVPLTYADDSRLPEWGFGMTNLVAKSTPGIDGLTSDDYAAGRKRLLAKIRRYHPRLVVLLGVTLYPILCPPLPPSSGRSGRLGLQSQQLAGAKVFVLPNPSGRNAHYSYEAMLAWFRTLKDTLDRL